MRKKFPFLYLVIFLPLFPIISFSQNELHGIVKDARTGLLLQGASIYLPDIKKGSVTDKNGSYLIKNIPAGFYLIQASVVDYAGEIGTMLIKGNTEKNYSLPISDTELSEIIVTGVSTTIERRKSPVSSNVLSPHQLLQSAAGNVIDAIQSLPGISQITDGPAISKPVIRGLGYNRVVVMNDGIRQEGQQWGDEFGIEVDAYAVSRVEILKGPASLSYGSDAMAGVINLIGPNPLPEGKISGNILSTYQTNNGLRAMSVNLAGNQHGFDWDLRYTLKQAHDYQNKYDGFVWNSAYAENDGKLILGLTKKWGYSHLVLSQFSLKTGIVEGSRDSATGMFTKHFLDVNDQDSLGIAPSGDYTKYNNYPIIHQHVRHYKAVWDNNFLLGQGRVLLKLGLQQNYRQEANDITHGDIYNNYFFLRTINYDAQYILERPEQFTWSFGINGMRQSSADRGTVFLVPEYHLFDIGFFSTAKKTIGKLTISGGIRFDARNFQTKNLYVDSNGVRLETAKPNSIRRYTAFQSKFSGFSGSLGAAYDFTKNIYAKINFSRGYRAPSVAESSADGIHDGTPFYEIGDPNLQAESSFQVDVTMGIQTDDVTAEVTPFVNKINHYIFPVKLEKISGGDSLRLDYTSGLPAGTAFKYVAGDAVLSGGEIMLSIHPHGVPWLRLDNSFSLVNAIQLHQGDSTKYLPYTPPQKLVSTLAFSLKKINEVFQHNFFRIGIENYFKQDKIYYKFGNETITPGYILLNAGISTGIFAKGKEICSVYLAGDNLADVPYQSNMSRLKYSDTNNVTGRVGVYNMGRNFSVKLVIPIAIKD
jgi:iron complex outermembrane receptor protein